MSDPVRVGFCSCHCTSAQFLQDDPLDARVFQLSTAAYIISVVFLTKLKLCFLQQHQCECRGTGRRPIPTAVPALSFLAVMPSRNGPSVHWTCLLQSAGDGAEKEHPWNTNLTYGNHSVFICFLSLSPHMANSDC